MSKQQGYQQLDADVPDGQEYGFTARLPQAAGSCQEDDSCHSSSEGSSTSRAYPPAGYPPAEYPPAGYPPAPYAGAPVAGYPVMTSPMQMPMAGPVGMVAQDPLGRRGRRQARRMGRGAGRGRRRGGPVHAIVGLVRRAMHFHQSNPPASGPSYQ